MAPRLRVLAGTSPETMVLITSKVNTDQPHSISSELYEGEVVANIKDFPNPEGRVSDDSGYFGREDRQGITWSIQVRGRFLATYSADDILFGNTFDRPLKLPWGSSAALKFMSYIDPTLEHDLTSPTKPWALSPLISTMPHFMHTRISLDSLSLLHSARAQSELPKPLPSFSARPSGQLVSLPPFPPSHSIRDDTSQLHLARTNAASPGSFGSTSSSASSSSSSIALPLSADLQSTNHSVPKVKTLEKAMKRKQNKTEGKSLVFNLKDASQRRSYFSTNSHRQDVQFGPEDLITTDFCYGFIEFHPALSLRLPGGLSFDLMRYWDGQPVRFVCCERKDTTTFGEDPWGKMFWCVSIEIDGDSSEAGRQ